MEEASKDASIIVHVNEDGIIVKVFDYARGEPLTDKDYDDDEKKRMDDPDPDKKTLLYTPNGCCWRKVAGRWRCDEAYCR